MKTSKSLSMALAIALAGSATGCELLGITAGGGGGGGGSSQQIDGPGAYTASEIIGTWNSVTQNCVPGADSDGDGDGDHALQTMTVNSDGTFSMDLTIYDDAGCTSGEMTRMIRAGTYTFGDGISGGGIELDLLYTKFAITHSYAALAQLYDGITYCGHTDWESNYLGQERNLTGDSCDNVTGTETYTITAVYEDEPSSLYMGDTSTGDTTSPTERPTDFLSTASWAK